MFSLIDFYSFKFLLTIFVSAICTGGGLQKVRTHLYGSLLYYLQIAQRPDEPDTLEAGKKGPYFPNVYILLV